MIRGRRTKASKLEREMKMRILQLFSICFEFPFHLFVIRNKFQFFTGFSGTVGSMRSRAHMLELDTGVHRV